MIKKYSNNFTSNGLEQYLWTNLTDTAETYKFKLKGNSNKLNIYETDLLFGMEHDNVAFYKYLEVIHTIRFLKVEYRNDFQKNPFKSN